MKKEKGITLIALIVTIIILIILAAVSINIIWNDNGIITKAQEAKKLQEIAEIKEKLGFAILAVQTDVAIDQTRENIATLEDITTKSIMDKLSKEDGMNVQVGEIEETQEGEQKTITVEKNGEIYTFIIDDNMNINSNINLAQKNNVIVEYSFNGYVQENGTNKTVEVDIIFTNMNGIASITLPDGTEKTNNNENIAIHSTNVILDTDYTYVITLVNGEKITKVVNITEQDVPKPYELQLTTNSNVIYSNEFSSCEAYKAFDRIKATSVSDTNFWSSGVSNVKRQEYIGYDFREKTTLYGIEYWPIYNEPHGNKPNSRYLYMSPFTVQGSNGDTNNDGRC